MEKVSAHSHDRDGRGVENRVIRRSGDLIQTLTRRFNSCPYFIGKKKSAVLKRNKSCCSLPQPGLFHDPAPPALHAVGCRHIQKLRGRQGSQDSDFDSKPRTHSLCNSHVHSQLSRNIAPFLRQPRKCSQCSHFFTGYIGRANAGHSNPRFAMAKGRDPYSL
jgi:hypothetical protein